MRDGCAENIGLDPTSIPAADDSTETMDIFDDNDLYMGWTFFDGEL